MSSSSTGSILTSLVHFFTVIRETHHVLLMSVRKVVPTLTSTSTEIYLSMAGDKQLDDTSFILVPARAVRLAGVCSRHCIALHCVLAKGAYKRGGRGGSTSRSLRFVIEARCQYRGEGGKRVSVRSLSSPRGQGTASSFYRPRVGGLQLCRTVLTTCGGMVYSATEWMAVLANLALVVRHGDSCSRPGAASRVAVWELLIRSPSVRWPKGSADGRP
jgi:hypothetical protein